MADLAHLSRILVLEDEALIALDLEATLLDAGVVEIVSAANVHVALAALERTTFDGAILDLHLGAGGSSYDVARRLQANDIPFVFFSGSTDVAEGFREVPLVTKPFSSRDVVGALRGVTLDRATQAA